MWGWTKAEISHSLSKIPHSPARARLLEENCVRTGQKIEEGIALNLSANFIPTDLTRLPIESLGGIVEELSSELFWVLDLTGKLPLIFHQIVLDVILLWICCHKRFQQSIY